MFLNRHLQTYCISYANMWKEWLCTSSHLQPKKFGWWFLYIIVYKSNLSPFVALSVGNESLLPRMACWVFPLLSSLQSAWIHYSPFSLTHNFHVSIGLMEHVCWNVTNYFVAQCVMPSPDNRMLLINCNEINYVTKSIFCMNKQTT